ncbi:MAG: hypothetical protein ACJ76Z_08580 [Thermoleophilaceae bacterium]
MDDGDRVIALKRGDVCCRCGSDLPSGFRALWNFYSRTITCLECAGLEQALETAARTAEA